MLFFLTLSLSYIRLLLFFRSRSIRLSVGCFSFFQRFFSLPLSFTRLFSLFLSVDCSLFLSLSLTVGCLFSLCLFHSVGCFLLFALSHSASCYSLFLSLSFNSLFLRLSVGCCFFSLSLFQLIVVVFSPLLFQ